MGLAGQGRAERGAGGGACEPTGEDEELGATSGGGEVTLCTHGRDGCATLHLQPRAPSMRKISYAHEKVL